MRVHAHVRAGLGGGGVTLGVPLFPAEGAFSLVPPVAAPPSCRGGCERAAGEINNDRVRVRVCADAGAGARAQEHLRAVTSNAHGAGCASGEERTIVLA